MLEQSFQPFASEPLQEIRAVELPDRTTEIIGLWVTYPSGRRICLRFSSALARGLFCITVAGQALDLRPVNHIQ